MTPAEHITLWLIRLAAPAQTLFVLIYGLYSPWWRSQIGWAIFTKALSIALLLDLALLSMWIGAYPGHDWVGVFVFSLVFGGAWLQLSALLVDKFRHRHELGMKHMQRVNLTHDES